MIKPTLCPGCGAFVRLTWTEYCGACGAELVFAESHPSPVDARALTQSRLLVDWLCRPHQVIGLIVGIILLSCVALSTFAMSHADEDKPQTAPSVSTPPATGPTEPAAPVDLPLDGGPQGMPPSPTPN